jgi:hypothetical protein
MTQDLEKAKRILSKTFCFMEWQANDARERGQELMDENDIKFLLSLDGISEKDVLHCFDVQNDNLSKLLLLKTIQRAKNEGKKGVIFGTTLGNENQVVVEQRGYFIKMTGHGSSLWDEIYFSEEVFIKSEISYFKNLFGSFASVASMI